MSSYETSSFTGTNGRIVVHHWLPDGDPSGVVVLAHGIGEHAGRYQHVAEHLNKQGFAFVGPDHAGHGLSAGEPGLIEDIEVLATDFGTVATQAAKDHPGKPLVVLGHSMGGIVSTRALQRELVSPVPDAWVLSGPVIGGNPAIFALLDMDPIPEVPIDPGMLSRDPKVGEKYASDPLVYHGPLIRPTLQTLKDSVQTIADAGPLGAIPTLYLHGEEDPLAPYASSKPAFDGLGLSTTEEKVYPGARHEILNETNKDEVLGDITAFLQKTLA